MLMKILKFASYVRTYVTFEKNSCEDWSKSGYLKVIPETKELLTKKFHNVISTDEATIL